MNAQQYSERREEPVGVRDIPDATDELILEPNEASAPGAGPLAALKGFTPEQRERLARLRSHVHRGERSDSFPVDRRQDFVRWLIARGKLSDSLSDS
jgi:hypothetical protein